MTLHMHRLWLWFIIFVFVIDLTQVSKLPINIVLSFSDIDLISQTERDVKCKFGLKWNEISIFVFLPFISWTLAHLKICYFNMSKSYFIISTHHFTLDHTSHFLFFTSIFFSITPSSPSYTPHPLQFLNILLTFKSTITGWWATLPRNILH